MLLMESESTDFPETISSRMLHSFFFFFFFFFCVCVCVWKVLPSATHLVLFQTVSDKQLNFKDLSKTS